MPPCFVLADELHGRSTDAVVLRDWLVPSRIKADRAYLPVREFSPRMRRSRHASRSPFHCHVGHVLSACPEKQMIGIAARRVVTAMADKHSVRDRAVVEFPRETMNFRRLSLPVKTSVVTRWLGMLRAYPLVASSGRINSGIEGNLGRKITSVARALSRRLRHSFGRSDSAIEVRAGREVASFPSDSLMVT